MAKTYAGEYPPDTGCEHSPSCLACPLPICKYDSPRSQRQAAPRIALGKKNDLKILAAINRGMHPKDVAKECGVTVRTVFRSLERNR